MTGPVTSALTLQFLAWVSDEGRTYAEAMDAWRTSCPRLSIWEDAVLDGLVRIDNVPGQPRAAARVQLTRSGRALLARHPKVRAAAGSGAVRDVRIARTVRDVATLPEPAHIR